MTLPKFASKDKSPSRCKGRGQRGGNVNMRGLSRLFKPHRRRDYILQPMTYIYKKTEPLLGLGLKRRLPTLPPK